MHYYRQLDTLRFLSVTMVMFGHLIAWDTGSKFLQSFHWGNGVMFFFVLSGFLITEILYRQKKDIADNNKTLGESLKVFYARRTLRIFPVYYLLVLLLYCINFRNTKEILPYLLTYSTNILEARTNNFVSEYSHFWSLAVEEQFYICWPILIFMIPQKHLLKFILFTIVFSLISRFCFVKIAPEKWMAANFLTNNVMFALGLGALIASIKQNKVNLFNQISKAWYLTPLGIIAYLLSNRFILKNEYFKSVNFIFDEFLFSLIAAVIIIRCVGSGYKYLGKFILENRVFSHLGQISYGIYLFHLFIPVFYYAYINPHIQVFVKNKETVWVMYFVVTWFLAEISYWLIEKPFNYFKKYFV